MHPSQLTVVTSTCPGHTQVRGICRPRELEPGHQDVTENGTANINLAIPYRRPEPYRGNGTVSDPLPQDRRFGDARSEEDTVEQFGSLSY
jgi:hypothetical protein